MGKVPRAYERERGTDLLGVEPELVAGAQQLQRVVELRESERGGEGVTGAEARRLPSTAACVELPATGDRKSVV